MKSVIYCTVVQDDEIINTCLLLLSFQEWETKAGEAKMEYDKAKKEYKESGGMSSSASKK